MKKSPSSKKKNPVRKSSRPQRQRIVEPPATTPERKRPSLAIQNILVPIDFSIHSKNALRYAISMAEQYGATLHLIYVIEPTIYPADLGFGQVVMPGMESELRVKSEEEMKMLIETEIGHKASADAVVRMGKPHQEILQEAQERNIDLIILATHGHTGVEQMLFGSTAMRVVRLAKCPVMTIRPEEESR
jgi:nucleotide-binding universal stress UspA family protein